VPKVQRTSQTPLKHATILVIVRKRSPHGAEWLGLRSAPNTVRRLARLKTGTVAIFNRLLGRCDPR
ncbi:MAG: hypothetical protein ACK56Q_10560, partial [Pirellulaceae bacterium]